MARSSSAVGAAAALAPFATCNMLGRSRRRIMPCVSDLQCPAIVLLFTPESIVGSDLGGRRLSGLVIASSIAAESRARVEAQRLATEHACRVEAAEIASGQALVEQVDQLSDLYRGETVAVVATPEAVRDALDRTDPPNEVVAVAVDSDGWNVLSQES